MPDEFATVWGVSSPGAVAFVNSQFSLTLTVVTVWFQSASRTHTWKRARTAAPSAGG